MHRKLDEKLPVVPLEAGKEFSVETPPKKENGIVDSTTSVDTRVTDEVEEPHCVGLGSDTIISGKLANKLR